MLLSRRVVGGRGLLDDCSSVRFTLVSELIERAKRGTVGRNFSARDPAAVHVPEKVVLGSNRRVESLVAGRCSRELRALRERAQAYAGCYQES